MRNVGGACCRRVSKWAILFLSLLAFSCDRTVKDQRAQIKIKLPKTQSLKSQQSLSAMSGGWGVADPTTFNEIVCFAVAVEGPEPEMSNNSCTTSGGTVVMKPGRFVGAAPAGGDIVIDVPSGNNRIINLIGFAATDATACVPLLPPSTPNTANLSAPHIIATVTRDLEPGITVVEMFASLTGATKYDDCSGPLFDLPPASGAPTLTFTPPSPMTFSTTDVTMSSDLSVTVENVGPVVATNVLPSAVPAPFSFKGGSYPGIGGTCGSSLAPGSSCQLVLSFAPSSASTFNQSFNLTFDGGTAGSSSASLLLTGIGANLGLLSFSPTSAFDYGSKVVGSSTAQVLNITFTGSGSATSVTEVGLASPFAFEGGSFPGTSGTCGATISAACTLAVVYAPSAAGTHNDSVVLSYNDGIAARTASRDLVGTAASPALLSISNGPLYDFGNATVGSSVDFTFTLINSGPSTATALAGSGLAAPFSFKGGSYPGAGGTCGAVLAASASCTIVVTFSPGTTGLLSDTVQIDYNDGASVQGVTRGVQGTGVSVAVLAISNGPLFDYGTKSVGSNSDQILTVTNTGGGTATAMTGLGLAAPFSFKGGTYPGTGGTCSAVLAASANCDIVVTFSPATTGLLSDTIQIDYNDGASVQSATRDVQGTGASAALLAISDGPLYNYGTRSLGSNTDYTFTVSNTGGVTATAMTGLGLAAPFSFKSGTYPGTGGTCSVVLGGGANCTIVVTYSPTTAGPHGDGIMNGSGDDIQISYNDGASVQVAQRGLLGTGGHGPATQVVFTTQPANSAAGAFLLVTLEIRDAGGSLVNTGADATANVTLNLQSGTGTLGGTLTKAAVGGVATFTATEAVSIGLVGSKTIRATKADTSGGGGTASLTADSNSFTITHAAANSLAWTTQPATGAAGTNLTPVVEIRDAYGNVITSDNSSVITLTIQTNPGSAVLAGDIDLTVLSGVATWAAPQGMFVNKPGVGYVLRASDGTRTADSSSFNVTHAPASQVVFSTPPADPTLSGVPLESTIQIRDAFGNLVTSGADASANVTLSLSAGTGVLNGNFTKAAVGGMVVFDEMDNVYLDLSGGKTLRATKADTTGGGGTASFFGDTSLTINSGVGSWSPVSSTNAPSPRTDHTAIWTGTKLLIWGGRNGGAMLNTGAAYDPTTDTWTAISTVGAPSARYRHSAVWTGSKLIVWGGWNDSTHFNTGGIYDPVANSWTATSTVSIAGYDRKNHSAVWTGSHMLVFGGGNPSISDTSILKYNPDTDSWVVQNPAAPPAARENHAAAWTGSEMIIWGGYNGSPFSNGMRYDPNTNAWNSMAGAGAARSDFAYAWTGRELIVWGGHNGSIELGDGERYNPTTDSWIAISGAAPNAPSPRDFVRGLWTGSRFVVFGGLAGGGPANNGGVYDPLSDSWQALDLAASPAKRYSHTLSWTGSRLIAWGGQDASPFGDGGLYNPLQTGPKILQVSSGSNHSCAIAEGGRLKCWGSGANGRLGLGDILTRGDGPAEMSTNLPFVTVATGKTVLQVEAGSNFTCALTNDFQVKCWGANSLGQLGTGNLVTMGDDESLDVAAFVSLPLKASQIAVGAEHACALLEDSSVFCWGRNDVGQTGKGATSGYEWLPVQVKDTSNVSFLSGIQSLAAGDDHTCAKMKAGNLVCWGDNMNGQIGDSTSGNSYSYPQMVAGISEGAQLIRLGGAHSCATRYGQLFCWGMNSLGQVGDGTITQKTTPVAVVPNSVTSLAGGTNHTCAVVGGNAKCWGANSDGQIGAENGGGYISTPTLLVSISSGASQVTAKDGFTCVSFNNNDVKCFGQNSNGELGLGDVVSRGVSAGDMIGLSPVGLGF